MHTLPLRTLLGRVALAALLPLAITACGDDVTGNTSEGDTESDDDDDDSSATMTATTMTATTMTATATMTMTGMDTDPDTDTMDTDPDTDTMDTDPDTDTMDTDPDTDTNADSSSSSGDTDTETTEGGDCTLVTPDSVLQTENGQFYFNIADLGVGAADADQFRIEFWADETGTFDLADASNDNYEVCLQCVRLYEDTGDAPTGPQYFDDPQYFQSAGTMEVDAASTPVNGFASVTLSGVRLIEVTVDGGSAVSTPVAGGGCIDIADGTYATPPVCGNGDINVDEDCDGENLNEMSCSDLGNLQGDLTCNKDCTFDQSACVEPVCGDDTAGGDEVCDGADFAGETCVTLGFAMGELACSEDCGTIDSSGCTFEGYTQGFEGKGMPAEFALAGNADWFVTGDVFQEGLQSAEAGNVEDGELSSMELDLTYAAAGSMAFFASTDSEANFDFLDFYIDDVLIQSWSGTTEFEEVVFPVDMGAHTFRWEYIKDGSVSSGDDTARVDDIRAANGGL